MRFGSHCFHPLLPRLAGVLRVRRGGGGDVFGPRRGVCERTARTWMPELIASKSCGGVRLPLHVRACARACVRACLGSGQPVQPLRPARLACLPLRRVATPAECCGGRGRERGGSGGAASRSGDAARALRSLVWPTSAQKGHHQTKKAVWPSPNLGVTARPLMPPTPRRAELAGGSGDQQAPDPHPAPTGRTLR